MTDTVTDTNEHGSDEITQQDLGTLEHLSPNVLALDLNVRDDAGLNPDFVASVAEHGVLTPIAAVRGHDGVVRVRAGLRRTLAAREAAIPTVPVYVRPDTGGDEKAQVLVRVAEQIVENDQRKALTDAQRARGIQQMLDTGLSVTKTAKKLAVSRDTVKTAAAAAGSTAAMGALDSGQLSLAEAAAISEFGDDQSVVDELVRVAGTGRFEHTVAEIRQRRESDKACEEAAARFTEQGYTVIEERPGWYDTTLVHLGQLRTAEGLQATQEAIGDPAHWAVYLSEDTAYVDAQTGEPVDDDEIDWECPYRTSGEPQEGKRHPNTVDERVVFDPEWFCTDYAAAGLTLCELLAKRVENASAESSGASHPDAQAQAAEQAELARRVERRQTIALNKLGAAAATVRRVFIAQKILSRKTTPKGADIFVASCLTRDASLLDEYHGRDIAAELLGVSDSAAIGKAVADLGASGDGRAQVITLALVLGALAWIFRGAAWPV